MKSSSWIVEEILHGKFLLTKVQKKLRTLSEELLVGGFKVLGSGEVESAVEI